MNAATTERIYTGNISDLNSEVVVHPGTSDWGDTGWFVSVEVRIPGRAPFITPKSFHPGDSSKLAALTEAVGMDPKWF